MNHRYISFNPCAWRVKPCLGQGIRGHYIHIPGDYTWRIFVVDEDAVFVGGYMPV